MVSRLGGEEFAVVVTAAATCWRSCSRGCSTGCGPPGAVGTTISIGATVVRPDDTVDSALLRADALLYRAKAAGRDRVVLDPAEEDASEGASEPA